MNTRVVHSSHFWAIFGSFLASFLDHLQVFSRRMIRMDWKMMWKRKRKMATVKRQHFKNEAKMHFTYPRQSSAHSNSTSKDLTKFLCKFITCRHPSESKLLFTSCWGVGNGDYIVDIYILFYYLQIKLKKKNGHDYVESATYLPCDGASSSSYHPHSWYLKILLVTKKWNERKNLPTAQETLTKSLWPFLRS